MFLEEEVYYDSNTFVLSDRLRDRLDDDRPGDRVSGRFDDMDEEDDFVVSSRLELVAKAPRIGDSRFRIIPSVTYDYFTQNEEKSHPTFGLTVDHNSGTGTASLDLEYELDAFRKNYLEDATDLTLLTYANGVYLSLQAAKVLREAHGVAARVFDLRWLGHDR